MYFTLLLAENCSNWTLFLLAFLDLTVFLIAHTHIYRLALFCICSLVTFAFLFHSHLSALNVSISRQLVSLQRNRLTLFRLPILLKQYRTDHHCLQVIATAYDQTVSSRLLLATFLLTFAGNLLLYAQYFTRQLHSHEYLFIANSALVQWFIATFISFSFISMTDSFNCSSSNLFLCQLHLPVSNICLNSPSISSLLLCKLKLQSYYELVHSKNRFTFHFGPFGRITRFTYLKFFSLYLAYIIKVIKRFI